MFGIARRILPSDDLAWDAVQTTLVRLWKGTGLPQHACAVLLSVVRSVSLEILRGERRRAHHESVTSPMESSERSDPAYAMERKEIAHRILEAVLELPSECRDALLIRFGSRLPTEPSGERDYRSVARVLGIPVGTVRSRLSRARRMLAERHPELAVA